MPAEHSEKYTEPRLALERSSVCKWNKMGTSSRRGILLVLRFHSVNCLSLCVFGLVGRLAVRESLPCVCVARNGCV